MMIEEYILAENYLLEITEEFKNGMAKVYSKVDYRDVDDPSLKFSERFSHFLYNILMIIDFQKDIIENQPPMNRTL